MTRRRKRRGRGRRSSENGWIDRIWTAATDPRAVGLCLLAAGTLLAVAPWSRAPEPLTLSWWESPLDPAGVVPPVAGLVAVAALLLVGALWNRYRLATDSLAERSAQADAVIEQQPPEASVKESRLPGLAWAGAVCMVAGALLVIGGWFAVHSQINAARMSLAAGETVEHYEVERGAETLKVMLPLRLRLDRLQVEDTPVAHLQAFEVGDEPAEPLSIEAGGGLELDGFRVTFVGMRPHDTKLAAVFASDQPDTIRASATEGQTFRVSLDGREFEVLEVTRNYLGVMGPAARVRSSQGREFWVFQTSLESKVAPDLGHSLRLEALRTQPAAVFTVARSQPFWPLSVGGTLFVLGFALLIAFPERIVRLRGEDVRLWSINEAGRVVEQTLDELADTEERGAES